MYSYLPISRWCICVIQWSVSEDLSLAKCELKAKKKAVSRRRANAIRKHNLSLHYELKTNHALPWGVVAVQ